MRQSGTRFYPSSCNENQPSHAQIAHALWTQLCAEHGIGHDGHLLEDGTHTDDRKEIFFYEADDGHYVPRSILLDLEPRVLQAIQSVRL